MPKLSIFNHVSLDGYFTDANNDMSWAHKQDDEWNKFAAQNAGGGGMLLFGRVTYEMMASWWPTPEAAKQFPEVAQRMNSAPKVVFSRSLKSADWANTTLVKEDLAGYVRKLKEGNGADMAVLGSGTIISQLTEADLIDTYQVVINNIILGSGRTMFEGVKRRPVLKRTDSRTFDNGNVVLTYQRER